MKIVTVVGARPQFIKAATVSREMKKHSGLKELIVHTGQHYDENMSSIFFQEMEIPEPFINLGIRATLQGEMTGKMLTGIEAVILEQKPDALLVYGDTNSTLAGALAASKLHIPLIHVEAGLRSKNMFMPEEINRIVTDRISNLLFCPTEIAIKNLQAEGFDQFKCTYINSGDVMLDAARFYSEKIKGRKRTIIAPDEFVLCTVHRAENTNDPEKLKNVITALNRINRDLPVIFPMHPRTKKIIETRKLQIDFKVLEPVGYLDMLELLQQCTLVMTDSGGLQKESFFFHKPCICLRNETEWVELQNAGYMILAGTDPEKIQSAFNKYKNLSSSYSENFFGNGHAAVKIVQSILKM